MFLMEKWERLQIRRSALKKSGWIYLNVECEAETRESKVQKLGESRARRGADHRMGEGMKKKVDP